jgi:transposase-like protein
MKICPKCKSTNFIKNGVINDKQRFKCKDCKFNFTTDKPRGVELETKVKIVQLYLEGVGIRALARFINKSHVAVLN